MTLQKRWIPSTSALLAFESAARHRNFSRAAEELNTSQSAISRHIATLEDRLGVRLFERHKGNQKLTEQGARFFRAVVLGLENIQSEAMAIATTSGGDPLTIACSHEVSHLFLMPRFDALQEAVGGPLRIMTFEYDTLDTLLDPRIDLVFSYDPYDAAPEDRVVAFQEAVTPVCSPDFAARHREVLSREVSGWGGLEFLKLTKTNRGWATWEDWFAQKGAPTTAPRFLGFENYVYLLEAAAAGRGLALGWRGMIERYLEAGTLVMPDGSFVAFDRPFFAVLTQRARNRPAARHCLSFVAKTALNLSKNADGGATAPFP